LPKIILDLPLKGCLNVHGSLLPKYRGAAPIQWAVIHGEVETGITIMCMDEGMDTGRILQQEVIGIGPDETAGELASRMAQVGGTLLLTTLRGWIAGTLTSYPQNESEATLAPILKKEDGLIDWAWPARNIAKQHARNRAKRPARTPAARTRARPRARRHVQAHVAKTRARRPAARRKLVPQPTARRPRSLLISCRPPHTWRRRA
jgi:methionyl-tRNA formyltransferase